MKSYLKLLMVLLLALTLVFACVSCGDNGDGGGEGEGSGESGGEGGGDGSGETPGGDTGGEPEIVIPPATEVEDTYIVDFVYVYQRTYINDFDRMESKRYTERIVRLEIPVENAGLTDENKAAIAAIAYNGYSFAGWYTGWDETTGSVSGDLVDFSTYTAAISSDMVFYADRGNLAGANATWEIFDETDDSGKVTATVLKISGTGAMFDFATVDNVDIPWYDSRSSITKVVVDEGITYIGSNAFYGLYAAKTLELPDSLEAIGSSSFAGWTKLTALETPANLKTIGQGAFLGASIKSLVLNEGLVEISDSAFNECTKITSIVVPSSLKVIGTGAFHPGSVDGKLASSAIDSVYYLGTADQFAKIDIRLDNVWFNEIPSVFYTPAEGYDPEVDAPGAYWAYNEDGVPVPMFYQIRYYLNSTVYGLKTPIFTDYVRTVATTDDKGEVKVTATVTAENVQFMNDLVYHNFKFVEFTNGVKEGLVLEGGRSVTCQVHKGTVNTSAGVNTGYLSNKGGLVWKFSFATSTITVTNGTTVATSETVTAALAEYLKLADAAALTPETDLAALLGIATAQDMATVSELGFATADEFVAFANKLDALELVGPNDPLIATAAVIKAAGIATVEELSAFIAEYEAYVADPASVDATAAEALVAKFEATTLDLVSLKALEAKLVTAGIAGDIGEQFAAIKVTLEALLANDSVNLTELQAKVLARPVVLAELSEVLNTKFLVGSSDLVGSAATVADLAAAVAQAQSDEGIFKTWNYAEAIDTANMWNASNIKYDQTKTIVFDAYVEHIGSLAFANLTSVEEIVLPESVKSIDVSAFSGCSSLKSIYYNGSELANIALYSAGADSGKTLANGYITGSDAIAYAKAEAATANEGKYWMQFGDKYVGWALSAGALRIGGSYEMVDFATAEEAPWYPAKDSITSVTIERHVTSVGENIANGYANVNTISFSNDVSVKFIPASAFAGTGVVENKAAYVNGLCIVERYYLLASDSDATYVKVPFRVSTIAEGALDGLTALYELELPSTTASLAPAIFSNVSPTIIYYNGKSDAWEILVANVEMPEDKAIYVALPERAETDDVTKYYLYEKVDGKFQIVVGEGADGCIHNFSEWTVTLEPTCLADGVRERKCNGTCGVTFTEPVAALNHDWSEWNPVPGELDYEQRYCQRTGCDGACAVSECPEHVTADGVSGPAHEKRLINSIFDFEGIDAIAPDMIALVNTNASSAAIVAKDGNNVFVFTKSAQEAAGFIVYRTQSGSLADANLSTFTADVSLGYTSGTAKWQLVLADASGEKTAAIVEIVADLYGNLFVGSTSGVGADAETTNFIDLGKKLGDTFALKVQYYNEGDVAKIQISVGETVVYVVENWFGKETGAVAPVAGSNANVIFIAPAENQIGTVTLDNVVFTIEKSSEFVAEKNTFEVLTFDEMPATTVVNVTGSSVTVAPSIITADDGNKYYGFTKGGSGNPNYMFYPLATSANATAAIFETDMYFPSEDGGSKAFSFNFKAGSTTTYMLEVRLPTTSNTTDGSDIVLAVGDKSVSADSSSYKSGFYKPSTPVKNGDWFNLRVEYYNAIPGQNAQTVRMLVYINGELVLYSNNWYGVKQDGTCPAPFDVADFTNVTISAYGSQKGEWGFDNTKYYHVYAETPTDPVTLKYDDFMENGWAGTMPMPNDAFWTTGTMTDDRAAVVGAAPEIPVAPDAPVTPDAPEADNKGTITFDDIVDIPPEVALTNSGSMTIVSEGTEKFVRIDKTGSGGNNRFAVIRTADPLADETSITFEAKMRITTADVFTMNMFMTAGDTAQRAAIIVLRMNEGKLTIYTRNNTQGDYDGESFATEVKSGDWFTLGFTYDEAGKMIVSLNGSKLFESTNLWDASASFTAESLAGIWCVPFSSHIGSVDMDNVAVYTTGSSASDGEGTDTPETPEVPAAPAGATTFDDIAVGEWAEPGTGSVLVGYSAQAYAIYGTTVVSADGNTYLSFAKTGRTDESQSTAMAWLMLEKTATVDAGAELWFQTRMKYATTNGSTTHVRLYNGRTAGGNGSDGTEIAKSSRVYFKNFGVKEGEWFTFRIVVSGTTATYYIVAEDGTATQFATVTDDAMSTLTCVQVTCAAADYATFDFDYIYFGAAITAPEAPEEGGDEGAEEDEALPGTIDFESMTAGNYVYDGTLQINQIIQSAATSESLIVSEDGNKFFRMNKTAGSSSSQTWFVAQRTQATEAGTTIMFQADVRLNFTKGSSAYIRFYKGRTADNGNNGTVYGSSGGRNTMFAVSEGKVTLYNATDSSNKIVLEAGANEWFTIRFVLNTNLTIDVYASNAAGEMYLAGTLDKTTDWAGLDPTLIDSFVYMNDSATLLCADFDNVYFGAFVPDVESPIEQQPEKEDDLPEGALTFNDIEEAALPEKVTFVGGSESSLGAVYVTKANKVLELKTVADSADYFYVNTTERNTLANQYVFATQMYLNSGITAGYVDYTLMPSGAAAADRVFKLRVITDGTKVSVAVVTVVDGNETVGEAVETAAVVADWFKLSIVYTENAKFEVLVDGTAVATAEAPYGMFKDAAAVSQVLVECDAALAGAIYFENMSATQVVAQ